MTSTIALFSVRKLIDTAGDDAQRVDVESGIGFVEDGELRLQQRHLQDFVAFLFAARKPSLTLRSRNDFIFETALVGVT